MGKAERLRRWSGANWFLLIAPLLLIAGAAAARATAWPSDGRTMEAVLLFDACITLPALYALCYGRTLPLWQLAIRMIGIACLGIFLLGYVVPVGAQHLLPNFAWARIIGLVLLFLIELRLLIVGLRLVFGGSADEAQIAARTGAPEWVARLMLIEARLWKSLWRLLRRK
jgi:hypothetical protein